MNQSTPLGNYANSLMKRAGKKACNMSVLFYDKSRRPIISKSSDEETTPGNNTGDYNTLFSINSHLIWLKKTFFVPSRWPLIQSFLVIQLVYFFLSFYLQLVNEYFFQRRFAKQKKPVEHSILWKKQRSFKTNRNSNENKIFFFFLKKYDRLNKAQL